MYHARKVSARQPRSHGTDERGAALPFVDNRPQAVAQRALSEAVERSARVLAPRVYSENLRSSPRMSIQRQQLESVFGEATPSSTELEDEESEQDGAAVAHEDDTALNESTAESLEPEQRATGAITQFVNRKKTKRGKRTGRRAKHTSHLRHKKGSTNFKRPGFNSAANRLKKRGTDLAHRTSWEAIRDNTLKFTSNKLSERSFIKLVQAIAPALSADAKRFAAAPITQQGTAAFLSLLNSARENLRPGHRGRNRAIKGRFDSGVQPSSKPTRRSRSPSPVSRRQIVAHIEHGEGVRFFTRGSTIETSQDPGGISISDMSSSIGETLGRPPVVSRDGNEVIFK